MSNLFITTYGDAKEVALGDPVQRLVVSYTTSSVQSITLTSPTADRKTKLRVRLFSDADCFVTWGNDPTATDGTDSLPMGANNPEYFSIDSGDKVAVIERT